MSNLSQNVNRILKASDASVSALASKVGVHRRTIDRIQGYSIDVLNRDYSPSNDTIAAFSRFFGKPATSRLKAAEVADIANKLVD